MKMLKTYAAMAILGLAIVACNDNNQADTDSPMDSSSVPAGNSSQYPSSADDHTVTPIDTLIDSSHLNKVDTLKKDGAMRTKKGTISYKKYEPNKADKMEADASGIYASAEVMPSFPGGDKALEKWLENNLEYPEKALDNNTEGDVVVTFAVDEQGKVYTPKITSTPIGDGLEEEALLVVNKMPKWTPGRMKGKNVKTKFTLPVSFQLQ